MVDQINVWGSEDFEEGNAAESEGSKAMEAPRKKRKGGSEKVNKDGKTADVETECSSKRKKAKAADDKGEVGTIKCKEKMSYKRMSDFRTKRARKRNQINKKRSLSEGDGKVDSEGECADNYADRTVLGTAADEKSAVAVNEQVDKFRMDTDTATTEKQAGEFTDGFEAAKVKENIDEHEAAPVSERSGEMGGNSKIRPAADIHKNQNEETKTDSVPAHGEESKAELLIDEGEEGIENGELKADPEAAENQDETSNGDYEAEEHSDKQEGDLASKESEKMDKNVAVQSATHENQNEGIKTISVGEPADKSEAWPLIDDREEQEKSENRGLDSEKARIRAEENITDPGGIAAAEGPDNFSDPNAEGNINGSSNFKGNFEECNDEGVEAEQRYGILCLCLVFSRTICRLITVNAFKT